MDKLNEKEEQYRLLYKNPEYEYTHYYSPDERIVDIIKEEDIEQEWDSLIYWIKKLSKEQ